MPLNRGSERVHAGFKGENFLWNFGLKRVNGFGAVCGLAANYLVTFGLDLAPWPGKPHLLLYGAFGMVTCLVVAPLASALSRGRKRI